MRKQILMPLVNVDAKSWHGNTIRSRFEDKLMYEPNTGCWIWTGATRGNNHYGALKINQKNSICTHRLSYQMYKGVVPDDLNVLHTCDNALCCNPNHLYLGTQLDNIKDRTLKQRTRNRYSVKHLGKAAGREGGT